MYITINDTTVTNKIHNFIWIGVYEYRGYNDVYAWRNWLYTLPMNTTPPSTTIPEEDQRDLSGEGTLDTLRVYKFDSTMQTDYDTLITDGYKNDEMTFSESGGVITIEGDETARKTRMKIDMKAIALIEEEAKGLYMHDGVAKAELLSWPAKSVEYDRYQNGQTTANDCPMLTMEASKRGYTLANFMVQKVQPKIDSFRTEIANINAAKENTEIDVDSLVTLQQHKDYNTKQEFSDNYDAAVLA